MTPGFFDVLGVEALIGRTFTPADALSGSEPTVIVSYEAWKTSLGSDPSVVGRRLPTTTGFVTIIGVLPEEFRFPVQAPIVIPLATDVIATDEDGMRNLATA